MWTEKRARDKILEYGNELSRSINDRGFLTKDMLVSQESSAHGTSLSPVFHTLSGDNSTYEVEIS
jgi:hypothetical protein